MKFKFPTFLLWFLAAITLNTWFSPASAQSPEDYTVSITVPDQSDDVRDATLRDALKVVFHRVIGKESNDTRTTPLLGRAQAFVKQYSYGTNSKDETQLTVLFDQGLLDDELRGLGLPVWGSIGNTASEIELRVSGVRTPEAYAKLLSGLRGVGGIKHVTVREVGGGVVHLRVLSDNGANKLAPSLMNSRSFRRTDDGDGRELGFTLLN